MDSNYRQRLLEAGVNVDKALDRFMGNENLYDRFLGKFLQDGTYTRLEDCLKKGDAFETFRETHTLKGLAANLELGSLLEILNPMTEQLRCGDMTNIREMHAELRSRYEKLIAIIKENH